MLIAPEYEGPINVATGATVHIKEMVEILTKHAGVSRVAWDASKPDGQLLRRYDVSKLHALGFVPQVSLDEGLAETYRWYAANFPSVRR